MRVDSGDSEGRPLADRYRSHLKGDFSVLLLDPKAVAAGGDEIAGRLSTLRLPCALVDRISTVVDLPRDLSSLRQRLKADPDDGDAARTLATALAMRGGLDEAVALAERPRGDDPEADRWAAVDVVIGDEFRTRRDLDRATDWYARAIDSAKRPIDAFLAHWGAGLAAGLRDDGPQAEKHMAAALSVPGISEVDRESVRSLLKRAKEARDSREVKAEPTKLPPAAKRRRFGGSGRSRRPSDQGMGTGFDLESRTDWTTRRPLSRRADDPTLIGSRMRLSRKPALNGLLPLREKVAEGRTGGGRDRKPSDSKSLSSHGFRRNATPVDPSSGPSGHLLPQGEKAMIAAASEKVSGRQPAGRGDGIASLGRPKQCLSSAFDDVWRRGPAAQAVPLSDAMSITKR